MKFFLPLTFICWFFTANAAVDLTVINYSLSSSSVMAGNILTVYSAEKNLGSTNAGANVISIHLSPNTILTPGLNGDTWIGDISVSNCPANSTTSTFSTVTINLSNTLALGTYYIFFSADGGTAISESNETNNFAYLSITITPCSISNPSSLSPGGSVSSPSIIATTTPTLSWGSVLNSTCYGVYIRDAVSNILIYNNDAATTTNSFTVPSGLLSNGGQYKWNCLAKSTCSNSSCLSAGAIVVYFNINTCIPPNITSQPSNQAVTIPSGANFSISATGSNISYQWQYNPGSAWYDLGNFSPHSGVTTNSLSISSANSGMNGFQYRCRVSSLCTTLTAISNSALLTVSSPQVGSVQVTINPSTAIGAGAQWNLDGGSWQSSGTTLSSISTGSHIINFNTVSGWTSPSSQSINITNGNTTAVYGTYTVISPQVGSVYVTINPSGAISAGAQWNLDGGSWQSSGTTLSSISTGSHIINFNTVSGWTSPSSQSIIVTNGNTTSANGIYVIQGSQVGSVYVTISPSGANSFGAQWNLDGGTWRNSGVTLSSITTGNHTVNFNTISGYTSPSIQSINVTNGNTTSVTGTYIIQGSQVGSVQVTLIPSGSISAGAQWNIDNGSWQSSGTTLSNISVGNHTVYFKSLSGWTTPTNQNISVTNGNLSSLIGTYTQAGPTVTLIAPNGGQNLTANSNYTITASTSGYYWGSGLYYSTDGGFQWLSIICLPNSGQNISYSWKVPSNSSANCKVKIELYYENNGKASDISNNTFTISNSPSGVNFSLNASLSHIYWPYPNSSWSNRNGWKGGYGGTGTNRPDDGNNGGSGHAQGGHNYSDYFADDWNNVSLSTDCRQNFYAPISGTVIYAQKTCTSTCTSICSSGCCGMGFGNSVIIQSDIDPNYAFRVAHFYQTFVSVGATVKAGDLIGEIGMTGYGTGSHAHCAVYRNINQIAMNGVTAKQRLVLGNSPGGMECPSGGYCTNNFACDFIFDAVQPGIGGGQPELNIFANKSTTLCSSESILLTLNTAKSYQWSTGDTTQSITVNKSGIYYASTIDSLGKAYSYNPMAISYLTVPNINLRVLGNKAACIGEEITLTVVDSFETGFGSNEFNYSCVWNTGSKEKSISVTTEGWYGIMVSDTCGTVIRDSMYISFYPLPAQPVIQANGVYMAANTIPNVTYRWFLNGTPISGANTQFLTATSTGYYTVSVMSAKGCSSTSNPVFVTITGILDLAQAEYFIIYPNPSDDKVTVEWNTTFKPIVLTIYDLNGTKTQVISLENVSTAKELTISTSNLTPGVYVLELQCSDGIISRTRLIVVR